jgi:hypothetical protein
MSAASDWRRNGDRMMDAALDKLGRAAALELTARIVRRTPVRSGRARANWNPSVGEPDIETSTSTNQERALQRVGPVAHRLNISHGEVFWLSNGLPYIQRLEEGWSKQAPDGMVKITELEMKGWLERNARRFGGG